jgi:hypothetical protein
MISRGAITPRYQSPTTSTAFFSHKLSTRYFSLLQPKLTDVHTVVRTAYLSVAAHPGVASLGLGGSRGGSSRGSRGGSDEVIAMIVMYSIYPRVKGRRHIYWSFLPYRDSGSLWRNRTESVCVILMVCAAVVVQY